MKEHFEDFPLVEHDAKLQPPERLKNSFVSLSELEAECASDEDLRELFDNMVDYCLRYTETVCRFEEIALEGGSAFTGEERDEIERARTLVHDTTIDSINILARTLRKKGTDVSWNEKLLNRADFMKFAILTAFEVVGRKIKPEVAYGK